jgi:hypothetical protein
MTKITASRLLANFFELTHLFKSYYNVLVNTRDLFKDLHVRGGGTLSQRWSGLLA